MVGLIQHHPFEDTMYMPDLASSALSDLPTRYKVGCWSVLVTNCTQHDIFSLLEHDVRCTYVYIQHSIVFRATLWW